jgi:superfamily II DNA or RNA helicase
LKSQNEVREEVQGKALELSKNFKALVIEWATGVGKTYASVKIVDEIIKNNPNAIGYLICKESTHKKNWIDDINTHKMSHILKNVETILYASLHKLKKKADFIILDECHAITEKRATELRRIIGPNTRIIFLSATIPKEKKFLMELIAKEKPKYYTINLLESIRLGLLPKPRVIVHDIELKNDEKRIYQFEMFKGVKAKSVIKTVVFKERWKLFNSYQHIRLNVLCNELEYYTYLSDQMEFLDKQIREEFSDFFKRMMMKNKFLNIASQRKKFIASAKTKKAREILDSFVKSRYICFTGSIEQSLELGGNSSVNSKNHKKVNQELIDGFNSRMYSMLFAVNMLREGLNLTEVQKGLIIQLDSTVGSYFQMLGRMLRHKFPEVHLIRLKGTQDEKYFERAMVDFSEDFIENR